MLYNFNVPKRKPRLSSSSETSGRAHSRLSGFRPRLQQIVQRLTGRRSTVLESFLGRLELQLLEVLWTCFGKRSVRDVQTHFPDLAYTTLMTTFDRLHKKGILGREKEGRAYLYWPHFTRDELESHLAADALERLLGPSQGQGSIRPVLSSFIEAVSRRDELFLDELEELIRAKKQSAEREREGDLE